jgi:mannose-1-phosphate guanylyltransferase
VKTITIRKEDGKWTAIYDGKRIAASGCKSCVITAVLKVTKESTKYGYISILNEDGTPDRTILTGVHNDDGREVNSAVPRP